MPERRTVPRVEPVKTIPAKVKTFLPARILDISSRGAQVELASCLRLHVTCDVKLALPDGEVLVRATVRRCRAWGFGLDEKEQRVLLYRAGLEFDDVSPEALAQLSAHVLYESHSAPTASETDDGGPYAFESAPSAPVTATAPPREGPVKIRIASGHIRKVVATGGES